MKLTTERYQALTEQLSKVLQSFDSNEERLAKSMIRETISLLQYKHKHRSDVAEVLAEADVSRILTRVATAVESAKTVIGNVPVPDPVPTGTALAAMPDEDAVPEVARPSREPVIPEMPMKVEG